MVFRFAWAVTKKRTHLIEYGIVCTAHPCSPQRARDAESEHARVRDPRCHNRGLPRRARRNSSKHCCPLGSLTRADILFNTLAAILGGGRDQGPSGGQGNVPANEGSADGSGLATSRPPRKAGLARLAHRMGAQAQPALLHLGAGCEGWQTVSRLSDLGVCDLAPWPLHADPPLTWGFPR